MSIENTSRMMWQNSCNTLFRKSRLHTVKWEATVKHMLFNCHLNSNQILVIELPERSAEMYRKLHFVSNFSYFLIFVLIYLCWIKLIFSFKNWKCNTILLYAYLCLFMMKNKMIYHALCICLWFHLSIHNKKPETNTWRNFFFVFWML